MQALWWVNFPCISNNGDRHTELTHLSKWESHPGKKEVIFFHWSVRMKCSWETHRISLAMPPHPPKKDLPVCLYGVHRKMLKHFFLIVHTLYFICATHELNCPINQVNINKGDISVNVKCMTSIYNFQQFKETKKYSTENNCPEISSRYKLPSKQRAKNQYR